MASGRRPLNERFGEPFYTSKKTEHGCTGDAARSSFEPDDANLTLYSGRNSESLPDGGKSQQSLAERIANLDSSVSFNAASSSHSNEARERMFVDKASFADGKPRDLKSIIDRFSALKGRISRRSINDDGAIRDPQLSFTPDDFVPPLDSLLVLRGSWLQRERFLDEVQVGDVFCCSVVSVGNSGLHAVLLCYGYGKSREIDQLKIAAYCSSRDIPELVYGHKKEVADVYSVKDKVVAVVVRLKESSEDIHVSLVERDLPFKLQGKVKLGLIRSEELPPSYKTMCTSSGLSYGQLLLSKAIFHSQGVTTRMTGPLGLKDDLSNCSLLKCVQEELIDPGETAMALRKKQSRAHALRSVVQGVRLYKEGKQMEAMTMYNKALDTDNKNVEALVARGALYANNESYRRALEDFRDALQVDPHHQNALKYTIETLLAYARDLRDGDETASAIKCYEEVLELDSSNASALECLKMISASKVSSADQQPVVSSTRSDLLTPSKQKSWESLDSPQPLEHHEVEQRSPSVNRRRQSVMRDRHLSGQSEKSEMVFNEERSSTLKRHDQRSMSESSTSSHYSNRYSRSSKRRRRSSSSLSSFSSNDRYSDRRRSGYHSNEKSRHSKHGRLRSAYSSEDDRYQGSKISLSMSSSSINEDRRSSKRTSKRSRQRSISKDNRSFSQEANYRNLPGDKYAESADQRRRRSVRRTRSRSPQQSRRKSVTRETSDQSSFIKERRALGLELAMESSKSQSKSFASLSRKEDMLTSRGKSDTLDRYGMVKRNPAVVDIFGSLSGDRKHEQSKDVKQSSAAAPFPYFLSTDPVRKSLTKHLNVKVKGEGDKPITNFLVQAESGKRKTVMHPVVAYSESSSSLNTHPSASDTRVTHDKDFSAVGSVSDSRSLSPSRRTYSRSSQSPSSSYYNNYKAFKRDYSRSASRSSISSLSPYRRDKTRVKSDKASRSHRKKSKKHKKSRSKSGVKSKSKRKQISRSKSKDRTKSKKRKRHCSTSRSRSRNAFSDDSRSSSRGSRSRSTERTRSRLQTSSRSPRQKCERYQNRSRSYSTDNSYSYSLSSRQSGSRFDDSKQKFSSKKSAKASKLKIKSSPECTNQSAMGSAGERSFSKAKSKAKSSGQVARKLMDQNEDVNQPQTVQYDASSHKESLRRTKEDKKIAKSKAAGSKKRKSEGNKRKASLRSETKMAKQAEQEKELQVMEDFLATLKKKKTGK